MVLKMEREGDDMGAFSWSTLICRRALSARATSSKSASIRDEEWNIWRELSC